MYLRSKDPVLTRISFYHFRPGTARPKVIRKLTPNSEEHPLKVIRKPRSPGQEKAPRLRPQSQEKAPQLRPQGEQKGTATSATRPKKGTATSATRQTKRHCDFGRKAKKRHRDFGHTTTKCKQKTTKNTKKSCYERRPLVSFCATSGHNAAFAATGLQTPDRRLTNMATYYYVWRACL